MQASSSPTELPVQTRHQEQFSPTLSDVSAEDRLGGKLKVFIQWIQRTRVVRSLLRYSSGRGALLAGGIAYSAIFSLAAALTIALTVLLGILGRSPQLKDAVFSSLASALPGVLSWKGSSGIVDPSQLVLSTSFSLTGVIAVVVLLFSATAVMQAMKSSIRAMFGIDQVPSGAAVEKLRDLLVFITICLGVAASGILTLANTVIANGI